jgi:hypothetical protein
MSPTLVPSLPYLSCHAAAAMVRRNYPDTRIHLFPSVPRGPFGVQHLLEWKMDRVAWYVLRQPTTMVQNVCGSFCKLRGAERNAIQSIINARVNDGSMFSRAEFVPAFVFPRWLLFVLVVVVSMCWVVLWKRQRR